MADHSYDKVAATTMQGWWRAMVGPERIARVDEALPQQAALASTAGPSFHDLTVAASVSVADELATALSQPEATIPPKFFYDALGSALFAAICELPEYYPTRTEWAILAQHRDAIAQAVGINGTLIDLGAGDCRKAESLFESLRPTQYVAVDVSVDFLKRVLDALAQRHPTIQTIGVGTDFWAGLRLPDAVSRAQRTFFYPGSSIGNFEPRHAAVFLRGLRGQLGSDGGLLIGVDLIKPARILEPAYDDALGVTAAFNRNALVHANRILGADFAPRDWAHVALWNATASRIEMHLEAQRNALVRWPHGERRFAAGERILTEHSYKYTVDGFAALLRSAGLQVSQYWTDEQDWFAVFHARAASRTQVATEIASDGTR